MTVLLEPQFFLLCCPLQHAAGRTNDQALNRDSLLPYARIAPRGKNYFRLSARGPTGR
ncbi:hypothetical protein IWX78_002071 [Mycetocola sp. CAN_C7]